MPPTPSTSPHLALGARVKQLREERGYTLDELARRSDRSASYVAAVERGQRNVSLNSIVCLTEALGVALSELFRAPDS